MARQQAEECKTDWTRHQSTYHVHVVDEYCQSPGSWDWIKDMPILFFANGGGYGQYVGFREW